MGFSLISQAIFRITRALISSVFQKQRHKSPSNSDANFPMTPLLNSLNTVKEKKNIAAFFIIVIQKRKIMRLWKVSCSSHSFIFNHNPRFSHIFLGYSPTTNKTFRNHLGEDSSDISSAEVSKPQPVFFITSAQFRARSQLQCK